MILCLCRGVSDQSVRLAIMQGAESTEAIAKTCGAGQGCGACVETIGQMLRTSCPGKSSGNGCRDQETELASPSP